MCVQDMKNQSTIILYFVITSPPSIRHPPLLARSLSLSLSHTHNHTHTHDLQTQEARHAPSPELSLTGETFDAFRHLLKREVIYVYSLTQV